MKVVIVGGVAGGAGVAARLRRNDELSEIIILEKGQYISFANCGLPYYIGGEIEDKDELQLQTPESFNARFNVDVRILSEVISIDVKAKSVIVKNVESKDTYLETYDVLVLSPGAKPIRPGITGIEMEHVFTLRTIPDTYKIKEFIDKQKPKTAVIIGSGYIGIEMAENLHRAGLKVAMIEAQNHVIGSLDYEMAAILHNEIRQNHVNLYLESKVTAISKSSVTLENGREIPADMVLMSIGVQPETDFIKSSGLELGQRGELIVDKFMRTSIPDIYGLGDAAIITNFITGAKMLIPLASPANKQARIVADLISGKNAEYKGTQGTAIARVFGQTVAVTGESEFSLQRNKIPFRKSYTFSNSNAGYFPGGKTMAVKLLFTDEGNILGASIIGPKGVDKRIDVIATAVRAKMTVYDLQDLELAYAPPFSSAKDPVNMAGYTAANILDGMSKPFYVEDIAKIDKNDILLDVRTEGEYKAGHIPNAINIHVDDLRKHINELDKNKTIYVYCAVGIRSYIALRILMQNGFKAFNLSGGYNLWKILDRDQKEQADSAIS